MIPTIIDTRPATDQAPRNDRDAQHDHKLSVAEGPHWHDGSSLTRTQILWLMALLPAGVASGVMLGAPALRVMALAVAAAIAFDALANRVMSLPDATSNGSSITLGLLLAFLLPVDAPWWLVVVGCFLTIVIGKKLFGGWGGYPVHPVALSYAMLVVSWPARMDVTASLVHATWRAAPVEPLRLVKTLGAAAAAQYDLHDLLLGVQTAGVGDAMVLWLLAGGVFLFLVRQVPWQIPIGVVAGVVLCAWLLGMADPGRTATPAFQLLAGGTVFMAFFLAPEHTTSPVNPWPMFLYGWLGGVLLVLIRAFSSHIDGTVFAVLLMNVACPLLDRLGPRIVGLEVPRDA